MAQQVQPHRRRLRILGSAVLALAYVAAGRIDAFFHLQLQPWDLAAGWLLVEEAGSVITTWEGGAANGGGRIIAAGDKRVHAAAMASLRN